MGIGTLKWDIVTSLLEAVTVLSMGLLYVAKATRALGGTVPALASVPSLSVLCTLNDTAQPYSHTRATSAQIPAWVFHSRWPLTVGTL